MNAKRLYYGLLLVCLLLVVGIVAAAYGAQTMMAAQSNKLVQDRARLSSLGQQQTSLVEAKKELAQYADLYNISKVVVPESKDQAQTVRQIVNLASASDITVGSITFPASTLGTTPGASSTTATPGLTTPSVTPNLSSSTVKLSQLTAVPQIPGVYVLPITISSDTNHPVSYAQLIKFLQGLEQNRLTAEVSSVTISPNSDSATSSDFNFNLIVNVYIKP